MVGTGKRNEDIVIQRTAQGWRGWLTSALSRRIVPSSVTGGVRPRGKFPLRLTNPERRISPPHPCGLKTVPEVSDVEVAIFATGYSYPFPPLDPSDPCNQPSRGLPTNGRRDYEHRSSASRKRTAHGEPQLSFLNRQADRVSVLVSSQCFVFRWPVIPLRGRFERYCTDHVHGTLNGLPRPCLSHFTYYRQGGLVSEGSSPQEPHRA